MSRIEATLLYSAFAMGNGALSYAFIGIAGAAIAVGVALVLLVAVITQPTERQ